MLIDQIKDSYEYQKEHIKKLEEVFTSAVSDLYFLSAKVRGLKIKRVGDKCYKIKYKKKPKFMIKMDHVNLYVNDFKISLWDDYLFYREIAYNLLDTIGDEIYEACKKD